MTQENEYQEPDPCIVQNCYNEALYCDEHARQLTQADLDAAFKRGYNAAIQSETGTNRRGEGS